MKKVLLNSFFGILVTVFFLGFLEISVRWIPQNLIPQAAQSVPSLAPPDRGSIMLKQRGYRGKKPCKACPSDFTRIVTIGGSSTYGVPMYYSTKTYSAYLQRLLNTHRPDEHFEVLNAGIAGFGIWQIVEALENTILELEPDIVMLCAWFNDSSFIPGWYGYHNLSDKQAYEQVKRFRRIEANSIYQLLKQSKAYALLRYFLQPANSQSNNITKRKQKIRRSTPDEFREGVVKFVALAHTHHFRPVFVLEALNRTAPRAQAIKTNKYYQILEELAEREQITIVDTLTPLNKREQEWLFYDFIHPNEHGHQVIAQAIYDTVFSKS